MFHFLFVCGICCAILPQIMFNFKVSASEKFERTIEKLEEVTLEERKGHLRPFGGSGPRLLVEERTNFPDPKDFLLNYVSRSKPLKLSGVARNSRAVRLWTDEYLLALDVPADSVVQLETKKKENRSQETDEMHFHQFLKVYNSSEYYMVDDVPVYLRPDIMVPCSLQCRELMEKGLAFALMWFSSGGTKSVVHTDAYDNINCLIRGEKTFVLVDPALHRDKIPLHVDGSYSDIDVDRVDLMKYPSVGEAEFYHLNVSAGDCLYIPHKWIHQVRSYNSNVAVNFWWDHYASLSLSEEGDQVCRDQCHPSLSLDQVDIVGVDTMMDSHENFKDWFFELLIDGPATEKDLADMFRKDFPTEVDDIAREFIKMLDLNNDGLFTKEEHSKLPDEIWKVIQKEVVSLIQMMEAEDDGEQEMEPTRDEL